MAQTAGEEHATNANRIERIAIPPLDLNLAIDFVVGNYVGNNWKALRQDTQYAHPMRESMRRIWAPL